MSAAVGGLHLHPAAGHSHTSAGAILVLVFVLLVLSVWVGMWLRASFTRPSDDSGEDAGDGGIGVRDGPRPRGPRPHPEPDWWPEFERQFAAYVSTHATRSR